MPKKNYNAWKNMPESKILTTLYTWRVRFALLALILSILFSRPTLLSILAGLAVTSAGLFLRLWACGHLKKEKELTTSGPYRYTRNPLYLGNVFIGIGVVIGSNCWGVILIFALYFLVFYPVIILEEKRRMQKLFPLQYGPYSKKVPLFFPFFRHSWPKSPKKFSWQLYKDNKETRALFGALVYWAVLTVLMFLF
jgi:protein-S-isoprenylcysteine O-methyltransferase Ste14